MMSPATITCFLSIGLAMAILILGHVAAMVAICRRRQPDRIGQSLGRRGCPASRSWIKYRGRLVPLHTDQRPFCIAKTEAKGSLEKED